MVIPQLPCLDERNVKEVIMYISRPSKGYSTLVKSRIPHICCLANDPSALQHCNLMYNDTVVNRAIKNCFWQGKKKGAHSGYASS